jgi:hypothetical protein
MVDMPALMGRVGSIPENSSCPETAFRSIDVTDSAGLANALEADAGIANVSCSKPA